MQMKTVLYYNVNFVESPLCVVHHRGQKSVRYDSGRLVLVKVVLTTMIISFKKK
jgi:hypothetical protein